MQWRPDRSNGSDDGCDPQVSPALVLQDESDCLAAALELFLAPVPLLSGPVSTVPGLRVDGFSRCTSTVPSRAPEAAAAPQPPPPLQSGATDSNLSSSGRSAIDLEPATGALAQAALLRLHGLQLEAAGLLASGGPAIPSVGRPGVLPLLFVNSSCPSSFVHSFVQSFSGSLCPSDGRLLGASVLFILPLFSCGLRHICLS
jgi:hypothetical protein